MNSILTAEERILLQSLGCNSKQQAIQVLGTMLGNVPVYSELFDISLSLLGKLRRQYMDFAYEMRADKSAD